MSDTVHIKVTVIGTPRPIIHPSIFEALRAIGRFTRAHDRIGPPLREAMLALARTGGRP